VAFDQFAKFCIARRQRLIDVHDKKLRTVGIRPGIGHRDRPFIIDTRIKRRAAVDLVVKFTAPRRFAAVTFAKRVSALDHKIWDHAVKDHAVVIILIRKKAEILCRFWCILFEQFKLDRAFGRFNDRY